VAVQGCESGLPGGPGDGFDVAYVDGAGVRQLEPLASCWGVSFEHAGAVFSGLWFFASSGEHVGFESWLERDRLMELDADPDVVVVASQASIGLGTSPRVVGERVVEAIWEEPFMF
jgi:hypothetical protein